MKAGLERITDSGWGTNRGGGHGRHDWGFLSAGLIRAPWGFAATVLKCNPKWMLVTRRRSSAWRILSGGPIIRPPLLLCEPDGRLHVLCAGIHWRARRPGPRSTFDAQAMPTVCGDMIYVGAAVNEKGDLLAVFPCNRPSEDGQRTLYAAILARGAATWKVRRLLRLPERHCYPQLRFIGRAAHAVVTSDVRETGAGFRWGEWRGYRYCFRRITHLWTDDVHRGRWHARTVEYFPSGFLFASDIEATTDGAIHILGYGTRRDPDPRRPLRIDDGWVMHWRAASAGKPFARREIARGAGVNAARFQQDPGGAWHYLMNFHGRTRRHPSGEKFRPSKMVLACAGSWEAPVTCREVETGGVRTLFGMLARPTRFGGVQKSRTLDVRLSDPWANDPVGRKRPAPGWSDWRAEIEVSSGSKKGSGHVILVNA